LQEKRCSPGVACSSTAALRIAVSAQDPGKGCAVKPKGNSVRKSQPIGPRLWPGSGRKGADVRGGSPHELEAPVIRKKSSSPAGSPFKDFSVHILLKPGSWKWRRGSAQAPVSAKCFSVRWDSPMPGPWRSGPFHVAGHGFFFAWPRGSPVDYQGEPWRIGGRAVSDGWATESAGRQTLRHVDGVGRLAGVGARGGRRGSAARHTGRRTVRGSSSSGRGRPGRARSRCGTAVCRLGEGKDARGGFALFGPLAFETALAASSPGSVPKVGSARTQGFSFRGLAAPTSPGENDWGAEGGMSSVVSAGQCARLGGEGILSRPSGGRAFMLGGRSRYGRARAPSGFAARAWCADAENLVPPSRWAGGAMDWLAGRARAARDPATTLARARARPCGIVTAERRVPEEASRRR